jgi:SAM-dependent methyltransferase
MLLSAEVKTLWEIGAGNGNAAIPLRDLGFNIIPVEPLKSGALTLAKNGFPTFHATLEGLNLPNSSVEAIGAFDVLEHLEKPAILLTEIYRVLKPGGVFICSVPAYQWLFSDFDISIGHFRRYSNSTLNSSIQTAGLHPIKTINLFGFLVGPAYLMRRIPYLFGRRRRFEDVHELNNSRFSLLSKSESFLSWVVWLEQRLHLKFGLSLITLSRK